MTTDPRLIEAQAFAAANGYPKPVFLAFRNQFANAHSRGIEWEFTIRDWWEWWQTDNRWENRGAGRDKFVMARFNDLGPYHPANIYCATGSQNGADTKGNPRRRAAAAASWNKRRAQGTETLKSHSRSFSFSLAQVSYLKAEAEKIGISCGDLLRRIIDQYRSTTFNPQRGALSWPQSL